VKKCSWVAKLVNLSSSVEKLMRKSSHITYKVETSSGVDKVTTNCVWAATLVRKYSCAYKENNKEVFLGSQNDKDVFLRSQISKKSHQ